MDLERMKAVVEGKGESSDGRTWANVQRCTLGKAGMDVLEEEDRGW
jgi:hypothetical protein